MGKPWLNKQLVSMNANIALCVSEAEYLAFVDEWLTLDEPPDHWTEGRPGKFHQFLTDRCADVIVICIDPEQCSDSIDVVCAIVHEVVHLWQWQRDEIMGEIKASDEFEAYSIEQLTETFLRAYRKATQ